MGKGKPPISTSAISAIGAVVLLVLFCAIPFALLPRICLQEEKSEPVSHEFLIESQQSQSQGAPQQKSAIKAAPAPLEGKITARGRASPIGNLSERRKVGWLNKFLCEFNIGDFAVGLFTLILAFSTIGLWWTTHRLWKSGEKQIGAVLASVEAVKMTEMARIIVSRVEIPDVTPGRDKPPKFRVYFQNFGKTPGFIHRTTLHFAPAQSRTPLKSVISTARGGTYDNGFLLPPSDKPTGATNSYGGESLAANEFNRLIQSDSEEQLFVWGKVEFSPVFDETWVACFAYRINLRPNNDQKNVAVGGTEHWRYYKL